MNRKVLLSASAVLLALVGLTVGTLKGMRIYRNFHSQAQDRVTQHQQRNSLTVIFPSRNNSEDAQNQANAIAQFLSQKLGIPVVALSANDTQAVEALRTNQADIAFLGSSPAINAEKMAHSHMYLAEVHPGYSGRYTYHSVFVVRNNSRIKTKASEKQTLEQLRGKKIAFTSPISSSGFTFPVSELVKHRLILNHKNLNSFFGKVSYKGDYSSALLAVLNNNADVAAVAEYSLKAPHIISEQAQQLRVIYSVPGVPAHGIVIDDDVSTDQRGKIINAFLQLNQPQNNYLLRNLDNATELVRVDHHRHLEPARQAIKRVGIVKLTTHQRIALSEHNQS